MSDICTARYYKLLCYAYVYSTNLFVLTVLGSELDLTSSDQMHCSWRFAQSLRDS